MPTPLRSRRLVLAATALLSTALLAIQADARPWRHGVIEPKSDAGFILMSSERDFAKQHGLDIEIVSLKNENLGLRGILSGELDSYEGSPPVAAMTRGADVKAIGCSWSLVPHLIFARADVKDVKGLAGKTIATSAPGSMPDIIGHLAIEKAGLDQASVKTANVGGDTDRYRSLIGGVVDAAVISAEYIPIMDLTKVHEIAKGSEAAPEYIRTCYTVTSKEIASRPDDVAIFLAAEMDGFRYAMSHKAEAVALAQKAAGQKPDDPRPAFMYDLAIKANMIDWTLPIPVDKLDAMQATLARFGGSSTPIDVNKMYDPKPREKALSLLGK